MIGIFGISLSAVSLRRLLLRIIILPTCSVLGSFRVVFKGIMAMAHPPSEQEGFDHRLDDEIDEVLTAPHAPLVMSDDLVHFDIDPTNSEEI